MEGESSLLKIYLPPFSNKYVSIRGAFSAPLEIISLNTIVYNKRFYAICFLEFD